MMQSALFERPVSGPQAPAGLAWMAGGLVMADPLGHRLWGWRPGTLPTPIAGTGAAGDRGEGGPAWRAELASPCVVRADAAGRLTLLERDALGARVRRVAEDGRLRTLYRAPARREVLDLAVRPDGTVFLALCELTGGAPWVARLTENGRLEAVYGGEGAPFEGAIAIGTGPDGALHVLHGPALWRWDERVGLTLQAQDDRLAPSRYDGACLAALADGRWVVTLAEAGRVLVVTPGTGAIRMIAEADPWVCRCRAALCVHAPGFPAVDARGRVWAVDGLRRRVVRLAM
jgi:hypothetical protein